MAALKLRGGAAMIEKQGATETPRVHGRHMASGMKQGETEGRAYAVLPPYCGCWRIRLSGARISTLRMPISASNASQMSVLSATPEVESAAAKEQNYHDDDEKRVGVHESWMLAEHETGRIDSIAPPR
jgi:hypothetical protein